jgi:ubiquinone/menaquinone biosynthesis C-methylase UbiE
MYDIERIARGYAYDRPPVHEAILLAVNPPHADRALDVGSGAGRSAIALKPFADKVFGLEPSLTMARFHKELTVVGRAEQIPFRDGSFQLISAAGALNYVDNGLFLPEAARVLEPGGTLLIYDCSTGSRALEDGSLAQWFAEYRKRVPDDPDYDLDPRTLDFASAGLTLQSYEEFEVMIRMDLDGYQRYILTETDADVAAWCAETLPPVFGGSSLDVVFDTYAALATRS